jgi:hypothetical protein
MLFRIATTSNMVEAAAIPCDNGTDYCRDDSIDRSWATGTPYMDSERIDSKRGEPATVVAGSAIP